jgi:hypothetical protein
MNPRGSANRHYFQRDSGSGVDRKKTDVEFDLRKRPLAARAFRLAALVLSRQRLPRWSAHAGVNSCPFEALPWRASQNLLAGDSGTPFALGDGMCRYRTTRPRGGDHEWPGFIRHTERLPVPNLRRRSRKDDLCGLQWFVPLPALPHRTGMDGMGASRGPFGKYSDFAHSECRDGTAGAKLHSGPRGSNRSVQVVRPNNGEDRRSSQIEGATQRPGRNLA